jgi:hypothetical protein
MNKTKPREIETPVEQKTELELLVGLSEWQAIGRIREMGLLSSIKEKIINGVIEYIRDESDSSSYRISLEIEDGLVKKSFFG